MTDTDIEYRRLLQELENKAQEQYDKTVILLSTGALGISFAFLKDMVNLDNAVTVGFLISAWICWALSVTSVLLSFYSSKYALRKAIEDLDAGIEDTNSHDKWTTRLNFFSGACFIIGLSLMIAFVRSNIGG